MLRHCRVIGVGALIFGDRGLVREHCCAAREIFLDVEFVEELAQKSVAAAEFPTASSRLPERMRSLCWRGIAEVVDGQNKPPFDFAAREARHMNVYIA